MMALLADALVAVHLLYILFVVGGEAAIIAGGLRGWAWVRNLPFRVAHLCAIVLVAAEALLGWICPLTEWEYRLRVGAGQQGEPGISFVGRLFRLLVFYDLPTWFFTILHVSVALVVVLSMVLVPPRWRGRNGKG
jgi:hypothetical protein